MSPALASSLIRKKKNYGFQRERGLMHSVELILTITLGLTAALVFGYITNRIGLSPIVGYLLAGLAVGPHTPGYVADAQLATQLAEIGVILLMFGVGLHFHLKDLLAVKSIAIPGAIGQSLVATALGTLVAVMFGWSYGAGAVLGMAISVASTVVLMRVLMDNDVLNTREGHIAVGWLVVEDIFTVLVLVLLPALAASFSGTEAGAAGSTGILSSLLLAFVKLGALTILMLFVGARAIPWLMNHIARTRSRELFTLTVLVIALGIATGSALLFGASMALGAFLAGMVVGQSDVSHQAAADALPMRDAFAVLFFVSVGMLFDPMFIVQRPGLVIAVLMIVMVGKPLAALVIVLVFGYPVRTALTVAVGLAQIGEFSFILAELARHHRMLPDEGVNVLVAAALLSITANPLLFKCIRPFENALQRRPGLWNVLNWNVNASLASANDIAAPVLESSESGRLLPVHRKKLKAVVVGYGPVGRMLTRILRDFDIQPTIIDMNIDTVKTLTSSGHAAIYGDAGRQEILEAAGIKEASYLLVTLPDLASRFPVIATAKSSNPNLKVFVRARYLGERAMLEESGATAVAYEESEIAVALANYLLLDVGATSSEIEREADRIRNESSVRSAFALVAPEPVKESSA